MMGAAWTALICQGATVVVGWFLGTSLFPVWLPVGQVIACILAVVPMIVALTLIRFQLNWIGLFEAVATGGAFYAFSIIALDVADIRSMLLSRLRKRLRPKLPALTD
jgi:hypothetical protein